ncbi:hypothetical protein SETIT_7G264900v2 [Setaria italica]|uniref:Uncharacterized protein n=1 Tax=Setaria italica TaxID=4555 RepID=A0A368S014_SETIT|nr:hypothetical protein SETIT_7G264900v2 [Setaria italica]
MGIKPPTVPFVFPDLCFLLRCSQGFIEGRKICRKDHRPFLNHQVTLFWSCLLLLYAIEFQVDTTPAVLCRIQNLCPC